MSDSLKMEGIMANCNLLSSCFFYNNELAEMPCTYRFLMNKYCYGDFAKCARFVYSRNFGRSDVPKSLFPNEVYDTTIKSVRYKELR
jgi:hypothetical protein